MNVYETSYIKNKKNNSFENEKKKSYENLKKKKILKQVF